MNQDSPPQFNPALRDTQFLFLTITLRNPHAEKSLSRLLFSKSLVNGFLLLFDSSWNWFEQFT